jgi:membrane associated rhomboid family serine protease
MEISITFIIIGITVIVSLFGLNNNKVINDLIFYPPAVSEKNQWYRFFSSGLIHADIPHLLFNMLALFLFGQGQKDNYGRWHGVESNFIEIFGTKGKMLYLAMYLLALFVCLIPTYNKNKRNYHYRSLGASGAVSAVVFIGIMFYPTMKMGFFFIPPIIPAFIFGPLYLLLSNYLEKKQADNINHSAHIWGALFGVGFIIVAARLFSDFPVLQNFIDQVKSFIGAG